MTRKWTLISLIALQSLTALAGDADSLRVLITGDLLLDRGVRAKIDTTGIDALFSPSVDSLMAAHDVVLPNLECPVTDIVAPMQKWFIFRGDPVHLPALRRHGITHLNLANNHSIDQGRQGLLDTRDRILAAGMVPIGAGETMEEASRPVLLDSVPRRVWVVPSLRLALENYAYLPGRPCVSQEEFPALLRQVRQLRSVDPHCFIIILLHWGGENTMRPILQQVAEAHRLVEAGADAVVGHHSHTLQPVEHYRGRPIYYSIGNFIFDARRPSHKKACAVSITITKEGFRTEALPIVIRDCVPHVGESNQ